MYSNINFKKAPGMKGLLFALLFCWNMVSGQNVALHFDGDNDWVQLSPINGLVSTSGFTVEMWFKSTATTGNGSCSLDFRRLFALGGSSGPNRFEVGECNGTLSAFLSGSGIVQSTINVRDGQWHCISAVRSAGLINIYYDGSLVPGLNALAGGSLTASVFRLGHWTGGSLTPGQDWLGYIDEVKIWNIGLAPANLTACRPCVLVGNEPGLVAYWRFDEGNPGAANTGPVKDFSVGGANSGTFYAGPSTPPPFALNGPVSNYVASTAPMLYPEYTNLHIKLTDATQNGISVAGICEGEPVHFAIVDAAGNPVSASSLATVAWEYSDDCFSGVTPPTAIAPTLLPYALFNSFSFVSIPGHTALLCPASQTSGFVNRCYRATIVISNGIQTCTYVAQSQPLQICCKLPTINLAVTPPGPLCEGDMVSFAASISGIPAPGSGNNYAVSWCVTDPTGQTVLTGPGYTNALSINYPQTGAITLIPGNYCIKATVSNCLCPPVTVQHCFTVDPKPVCGTVKVVFEPATMMHDPDGNPDHFLMCPGNDAEVMIATPFTSCIPTWQYYFPNTEMVWHDLGTSNATQNTNTLPHKKPPLSPYLWPNGETCILYRIKCVPLSGANSGCPPCYSNEVRICLKQPTAPVISASPLQICKGGQSTFTVQNFDPNCTYDWYCNGLHVGTGQTFLADKKACYWVTCASQCFVTVSNRICLDVCETVAIISCPTPNCPQKGQPITINGLASYSTCGYGLLYQWTWTDAAGVPHSQSGSSLTDIPADCGTLYTLTVTDTVLGCSDTVSTFIAPCMP